jgi:hypothetical protein
MTARHSAVSEKPFPYDLFIQDQMDDQLYDLRTDPRGRSCLYDPVSDDL